MKMSQSMSAANSWQVMSLFSVRLNSNNAIFSVIKDFDGRWIEHELISRLQVCVINSLTRLLITMVHSDFKELID